MKPASYTLERLLTHPSAFGLLTASPLQRAICRIADGLPLGELAEHPDVMAAIGDVASVPASRPLELLILSGIRTGKSLLAAALAVRAALTCDLSRLRAGEPVRVSVVSLTTDLARVVFEHLVGTLTSKQALRALLVGEPTADTVNLRHPSGHVIEVKVVAGARAGASLVARWSAGVIFDEAPRMNGEEDGVVNFDDARRAALGRLLPGAQLVSIGSPWAPRGPVYEMVQERWRKPSAELVIIRAPAPLMNPVWWTRDRVEQLRRQDEQAYRTDVLGQFADPESSLFSSTEIERATRKGPLVLEREDGHSYAAAMDPGTRGNAWTLTVATRRRIDVPPQAGTPLGTPSSSRVVTSIVLAKQWQGSKADPLSPDRVCSEIAAILRGYGVDGVWTDQLAADFLRYIVARHKLFIMPETITAPSKVAMFESLRTQIADGEVELPDDPQVRADLLSIRKRVTMNGIAIELPRTADGRHADYGPALALVVAEGRRPVDPVDPGPKPGTRAYFDRQEADIRDRHEAQLIVRMGEQREDELALNPYGEYGLFADEG